MHAQRSGASLASPFSDAEEPGLPKRKDRNGLKIFLIFAVLAALGAAGFLGFQHLTDSLRVLQPFPVARYLENDKALTGARFRARLRVENDLGWKEEVGRLMVFTVQDDPHPIVVLIPPDLARIFFIKGQSYEAELEVGQGGLIHANSCRKN